MLIEIILLIPVIALGELLGAQASMWLVRRQHGKCGECGKREKAPVMSAICKECFDKAQPTDIGMVYPPMPFITPEVKTDWAELAKEVYSNPEAMKALRGALGIKTNQDLFDEDDEREAREEF